MPTELSSATPLAEGKCRLVYRHPADSNLLIKVYKPAWVERRYSTERPWYKPRWRRYHEQLGHLREVREYLALNARRAQHPDFLQKVVGFEETDLGLGLVVEAVLERDETLAPTISALIKEQRWAAHHEAAFDAFCTSLVDAPVIFTDLNLYNVVYGSTRRAGTRFVLIDGLGFKNLISTERMSKTINRWRNVRSVTKLRANIASRLGARSADHEMLPSAV